jgi:hypothetical protein
VNSQANGRDLADQFLGSALDIPRGNFYSRFLAKLIGGACSGCARVAELADALDLGSSGQPWGFESPLSHHLEFQGRVGIFCC